MTEKIWRLIDTGPEDADFNMALDIAISESVCKGIVPPTLRFYSWNKPSLSLGYFQTPRGISFKSCSFLDIPVVRRPTGGRAILHYNELTYSFSSNYNDFFKGAGLFETYRVISLCFVEALRSFNLPVTMEDKKNVRYGHNPLCFLSSSYGEVILWNKKILGSAQRRLKEGFLQQGSMPYYIEREIIKRVFNSASLSHQLVGLFELLREQRMDTIIDDNSLKLEIIRAFERRFNIKFIKERPSGLEIKRAEELRNSLLITT
ncbi:MAG: biotin/lipoate A/B protein ligase family protein [Thermodesulfovibrionales bacterium]